MSDITIKKLAKDLNILITQLIPLLREVGADVSKENDTITGNQQLQLMKKLNEINGEKVITVTNSNQSKITLDTILGAKSLQKLNDLLTLVMAKQQIQGIIKESNLDLVVDSIIKLASEAIPEKKLLAAAMLGRLAAVARGRNNQVLDRVKEIIKEEPLSLDVLTDELISENKKDIDLGKTKYYAAQSLRCIDTSWLNEYCIREALNIDTAENARRELLDISLKNHDTFSGWLISISNHSNSVRSIENLETQMVRLRRIVAAMLEVFKEWQGELGDEPGETLAKCFSDLTSSKIMDVNPEQLFDTLDSVLTMLDRLIGLRFSYALYAQTFKAMEVGKTKLGVGLWSRFLENSEMIDKIRIDLLESALVIARQNRTDSELMAMLLTCYSSKYQLSTAVKRHFSQAQDIDPDVYEWWQSASKISADRREVKQAIGNTEDEQIGALLIEVEYAKETMEKLDRAVAPMLEISDPVLAETVKRAASKYLDMAQFTRRLARMRKLTKSGLLGKRMEYNPREHEMRGGHKAGVRNIKVIQDGIRKDFNGKVKTLVKPLVEPDE